MQRPLQSSCEQRAIVSSTTTCLLLLLLMVVVSMVNVADGASTRSTRPFMLSRSSSSNNNDWSKDDHVEGLGPADHGQDLRNLIEAEAEETEFETVEDDRGMRRDRRVPLSLLMKRALSLFTQFRPANGGGGPINGRYKTDQELLQQRMNGDYVSAVVRDHGARPRGQPLRWG